MWLDTVTNDLRPAPKLNVHVHHDHRFYYYDSTNIRVLLMIRRPRPDQLFTSCCSSNELPAFLPCLLVICIIFLVFVEAARTDQSSATTRPSADSGRKQTDFKEPAGRRNQIFCPLTWTLHDIILEWSIQGSEVMLSRPHTEFEPCSS